MATLSTAGDLAARRSERRLTAVRAFATAYALLVFGALGGAKALFTGLASPADGGSHAFHEFAVGPHMLLIALLSLAVAWRPRQASSPLLAMALGGATVSVMATTRQPATLAVGGVLFVGLPLLMAWVHPDRRILRHTGGTSALLAPLALLSAVPLVRFAITQAGYQLNGPATDTHVADGHWAGMAFLALQIVVTAAVASRRGPGWTRTALSAGATVAILGAASIAAPDLPSSFGTVWGAAAVVLGGLFALAATVEERRLRQSPMRVPAARSARPTAAV